MMIALGRAASTGTRVAPYEEWRLAGLRSGEEPSEASRPAPGSYPESVELLNLSRPGGSFRVGDRFRLIVTGDPGQTVQVQARHDGDPSTMDFGTTDASGTLVIEDAMGSEHLGNWLQNWYVGGQQAGALVFDVGSTETKPNGNETNGAIYETTAVQGEQIIGSGETSLASTTILGIPLWMIAVGAGGILLLKGK